MPGYPSSTVWAQLALPNSPVGSIPFVFTDGTTIAIDVLNFYWNQASQQLSLHHAGDNSGTDSLNVYKQIDSYLPMAQQVLPAGSPAQATSTSGFTVSASNGTGPIPALSLTGDFIGKFSGWGYTGAAAVFTELAGLFVVARGATANNLGGEAHLWTKADNGVLTDRLTLDNTGAFFPTANAGAQLGKANFGYKQLNLDFTITAVVGAVAINKPAGRAIIPLGVASVVVTNSLVTANSIVLAQLAAIDATLTFVKAVVTGAGTFTITGNANATANCPVNFLVINTDS